MLQIHEIRLPGHAMGRIGHILLYQDDGERLPFNALGKLTTMVKSSTGGGTNLGAEVSARRAKLHRHFSSYQA